MVQFLFPIIDEMTASTCSGVETTVTLLGEVLANTIMSKGCVMSRVSRHGENCLRDL